MTENGSRYLTFSLSGETYALDILDVTEIIEYRPLTVVPMMPAFIRGVMNLRGRVLPVVDLASRFGVGETAIARRTSVIVIEGHADGNSGVGVLVDSVNQVMQLDPAQIAPPPEFGAGVRSEFISGMARQDGDFIIVLDMRNILGARDVEAAIHAALDVAPA